MPVPAADCDMLMIDGQCGERGSEADLNAAVYATVVETADHRPSSVAIQTSDSVARREK
jgi:hypothetical protein